MAYTKATKDGLLPKVVARNLPEVKIFDLSENLKLTRLAENLQRSINSPRPSSCAFIWGAERQVRRQELDIQHQCNILEQIRLLGLTADEMARTEARLFLIPETINAIIANQREEMAWQREEALKRMELADKQHADTLATIDDRAEDRILSLNKTRAEINAMVAHTNLTNLQGKLLDKVINELDINKITPEQAFVLVKALNPQADANVDFATQERMLEANLAKMKAETALKLQTVRKESAQADLDEYTVNITKTRPR